MFVSACLLTLAAVRLCLYPFPLVHLLASPPIVMATAGTLVLFLIIVTFILSWLVVGVAARFFLDPLVAALTTRHF